MIMGSTNEPSTWYDWYDKQYGINFNQYCEQHLELSLIKDE